MKKHTICSLLTLASLLFTGCVGTPTIPFQAVLTPAPLFRTLDKLKIEEEFDEVGTSSLSQEAQQELKAVEKSSANEKRVLLEIEKGDAFSAKNDLDTAIACYSHAIRLDPINVDAYYKRAIAQGKLKNGFVRTGKNSCDTSYTLSFFSMILYIFLLYVCS